MMPLLESGKRKGFPERIRVRLRDDAAGATPLELPERRMLGVGLVLAAMFVIFAAVAWGTIASISGQSVDTVFDLMFVLFQGFWVLGWSVGVAILGALTVFFLFYGESARLQDRRLVQVSRFGPVKIIIEYDLARVRNVRLERAGSENTVRVRFDYDEGSHSLGDNMPRRDGEFLVRTIRGAALAAGPAVETLTSTAAREAPRLEPATEAPEEPEQPPPSPTSLSGLALIGANLVPLAGVLFFGWDLASVMVLFWAESAIVGFYTAIKMAIVGNIAALVAVPFFIGHFGGFMAGHFLFIYYLFVRGIDAAGPEPGVRAALAGVFVPVWPALAALFISHGESFFENFVGRREYARATIKALMTAPYDRIIVMQLALIFGGWIIMLLKSPVPALALFVLIKIALDFSAHQKEHGQTARLKT